MNANKENNMSKQDAQWVKEVAKWMRATGSNEWNEFIKVTESLKLGCWVNKVEWETRVGLR